MQTHISCIHTSVKLESRVVVGMICLVKYGIKLVKNIFIIACKLLKQLFFTSVKRLYESLTAFSREIKEIH